MPQRAIRFFKSIDRFRRVPAGSQRCPLLQLPQKQFIGICIFECVPGNAIRLDKLSLRPMRTQSPRLLLIARAPDRKRDRQKRKENKAVNDKILEIIKWTQERVCERITVEDAAAELHYSKYHFCRLFKEHVGISYLKYINTLKIDHAAKLLREGHSSTYCCFECGFDSLSYFLKLFKDITGYTTSEYKKIMKIE